MLSSETQNIIASATASGTAGMNASESAGINATQTQQFPPMGEEIFDLMNTVKMQYPWGELLINITMTIIAIIVLYLFYCWLTKPVEKVRKPIIQSPHKQAERAITRMRLSPIWEQKNVKAICETIVAILKNYAKDEFHIGIGDAATTDEFIPVLIDAKVKNQIISEIRELLDYCDEARYTGVISNRKSPENLVETLEHLIDCGGWTR